MPDGQDELKNANILISGVEDTGEQIKIRDQNKRTFSFFKKKKGGDETVAFRNFQHFKIGDTVEVSFREVPYKEGLIKNVVNVKPATGAPEPSQSAPFKGRIADTKPGREYWEQREEKRQSSIVMQVAFKSAIALEAARVQQGQAENRERMYDETLEFYDWMAEQIGDGETGQPNQNPGEQLPTIQLRKHGDVLDDPDF
jgi:hypothetical protein